MTPFESGMAACTAPAIPKAIPTSVSESRSFLPSDRDESRFMTVSFHERCGGRRPAAAGDRKNDLYRPRFYALCIPESTRPRPGVGLLKGLPGVWNRRGAAVHSLRPGPSCCIFRFESGRWLAKVLQIDGLRCLGENARTHFGHTSGRRDAADVF